MPKSKKQGYEYAIITCKPEEFDDIKNGAKIPMIIQDNGRNVGARQFVVYKKVKETLKIYVRPYTN